MRKENKVKGRFEILIDGYWPWVITMVDMQQRSSNSTPWNPERERNTKQYIFQSRI